MQVALAHNRIKIQNMPNTAKFLAKGVFYAIDWILIEDGSQFLDRHSRVSVKAISMTRNVKKVWHYTDFAYDMDVMYVNIAQMFKLSMLHSEQDNSELHDVYSSGLDSLDEWYKKNRLVERSDIATFYFDTAQ